MNNYQNIYSIIYYRVYKNLCGLNYMKMCRLCGIYEVLNVVIWLY